MNPNKKKVSLNPMKKAILIFTLAMILTKTSYSQRFLGGIQGGINLAQVVGDGWSGYNKLGFNGGVFVHYMNPSEVSAVGFDLMYMGKGSRNVLTPTSTDPVMIYRYHYVEVPVYYMHYFDNITVRGGLNWSYAFSSELDDGGAPKEITGLKNHNFLIHGGAGYFVSERMELSANLQLSVNSIIDLDRSQLNLPGASLRRNGVYHNLIQVSLKYYLSI